jgi:hypothetical protein
VLGWPQLSEWRKLPVAGSGASSADKVLFQPSARHVFCCLWSFWILFLPPEKVSRVRPPLAAGEILFFLEKSSLLLFLLGGALCFQHYTLEFFEDSEVDVGVINFSISLLFGYQETNFFQPLQFALDVSGIFFNQLGQTANMGLKVGVLGIDHNNLAPHSGSYKYI